MGSYGTIMSGAKQVNNMGELSKYALFMGGVNVTNQSLKAYDPLRTGYGRIFFLREPAHIAELVSKDESLKIKWKNFKHILEYGNTAVNGINDQSVNFEPMTGGYGGRQVDIPTSVNNGADTITIQVYEFSGSPIREMLHLWINGAVDFHTTLAHYNGIDKKIQRIQANQSAEILYVSTDNTGENVEYACLLANAFPENINLDVFNYTSGQHNLVQTDIPFHCVKYESIQINKVAQALINKYKILANSLNFYSGYEVQNGVVYPRENPAATFNGMYYDYKSGILKVGDAGEYGNYNAIKYGEDGTYNPTNGTELRTNG